MAMIFWFQHSSCTITQRDLLYRGLQTEDSYWAQHRQWSSSLSTHQHSCNRYLVCFTRPAQRQAGIHHHTHCQHRDDEQEIGDRPVGHMACESWLIPAAFWSITHGVVNAQLQSCSKLLVVICTLQLGSTYTACWLLSASES